MNPLPAGFRFHPTEVEMVLYYLKRKVMGKPLVPGIISEIDLYKFAPWDLAEKSCLQSKDLEWYFFCPQDRKSASGSRMKRTTDVGFWKVTGKDRPVLHSSRVIGFKKTLVFYIGRVPQEQRTNWVMYEFRLEDREILNSGFSHVPNAFVLCKLFEKSGFGPKIGEHHGAPFREEDWEDNVVNEREISMSDLPYPSSRPLGDLGGSSESIYQQSVASVIGGLPPLQGLADINAFNPDVSVHLSENPNTESTSVILHENTTDINGDFTQNVLEGRLSARLLGNLDGSAYAELFNLPPMQNFIYDIEAALKGMIEDPFVSIYHAENADSQLDSVIFHENVADINVECIQNVSEEATDMDEMFRDLGELEPIDKYCYINNVGKEHALQLVPSMPTDAEYVQKHDLPVPVGDTMTLAMPSQLLSCDPSATYSSFQINIPNNDKNSRSTATELLQIDALPSVTRQHEPNEFPTNSPAEGSGNTGSENQWFSDEHWEALSDFLNA